MNTSLLFGAAIARNAVAMPSRPALAFGGRRWTYAQFDAWIDNVAEQLRSSGVGAGDCVGYVSTPRPEVFATMFALARLGAVFVPVHASSTEAEIARIVAEVQPVGLVVDEPSWAKARAAATAQGCWTLQVGDTDAGLAALTVDTSPHAPLPCGPWDPAATTAVIAHTSGTSGHAKGVRLTHANLVWSAINGLAHLDITQTDRTLVTTPLSHIAVLSGLAHYTWIQGGEVVLATGFTVESFYDLVADTGSTLAFAVPTMLELLARHPRFAGPDLDSLRWVLCGGATMLATTRQRYADRGTRIVCSYGLTESSAGVTYSDGADPQDASAAVVPFADVRVIGADGSPVPAGQSGEVLVRGPSVAATYLGPGRQPLAAVDANGWFHTGDRGALDERGRLAVSGRIKDTIITGGENVDPVEVEQQLARVPGVADAVVVGVAEPTWGQIVTAVVVAEDGAAPSLADITASLAPHLSSFKIPRRLVTRPALPRNATGKILRQQVVEDIEGAPPCPVRN